MAALQRLRSLLNSFKLGPDDKSWPITHTSMGGCLGAGKFHVPGVNSVEFIDAYARCVEAGSRAAPDLALVERHRTCMGVAATCIGAATTADATCMGAAAT